MVAKARVMKDDAYREARIEATIAVSDHVDIWLQRAHNLALKGQLAEAESLYHEALAISPSSTRGNFMLGCFYYDNGDEERGMKILRESGWLLEVPKFSAAPVIDGRLDDEEWSDASSTGHFMTHTQESNASFPSIVDTQVSVGYTAEALYFGAYCQ